MKNLKPKDYAKILYQFTKDVNSDSFDNVMNVFVKYLIEKNAVSKLAEIIKEFEAYSKLKNGIRQVELTTAVEVDENDLSKLKTIFGETSEFTVKIDKDILGGMVILEDDTLYDASIRHQLDRLRNYLE